MRLVLRVTAAIFIFITISSTAIGYFAISKYHSSQIHLVDASLNSKIKALKATKEDPLTVATYLAQVSAIPVTVEYLEQDGTATELTESGPAIEKVPDKAILLKAQKVDVTYGANLRIRTIALPRQESLIFADSLTTINSDVSTLTRELIIFIVLVDLIAVGIAFLVFWRDGKLNQVSHLIAAQQQAMQKFLGDASHELRTPLTVIKGYVDLSRSTGDPEKLENYLAKSSTEIVRMEAIINDLLFLAEVGESQDDEVVAVNLDEVIKDHVDVLRALQSKRTIEANLDKNEVIYANAKLIDRLVGNIFSNIRRHTPDDVPVSVELHCDENAITLVVEDGGPGLLQYPDKPRLLKRFTSQRSSEAGGSGLGLSIMSGVVERYHGTMQLSKGKLGGLRIEIKFPLNELTNKS